ncbi:acyloxyacyl hydrolase [Marinobacter salicampi]|uniref:acyloxyacyl hydrolase n=1 Tax=Marinobacter salicampi TaxID=435907 RepID=UPI001408D792|nr:acyloxyacyl hydrolase [Marinobacter salicampi]
MLAESTTVENEENEAPSESQPYPPGQSLLNVTAGQVGIDRHLESPWRYGVEYRMAPVTRYRLVPSFGLAWTSDDANFIYAELRRDFHLGGRWLLTPSFGVGRFNSRPNLDLGLPLEFRSGLELSYRFEAGYRLGAAIFHLSNGGLSEENPGTEAAVLSFSLPFP